MPMMVSNANAITRSHSSAAGGGGEHRRGHTCQLHDRKHHDVDVTSEGSKVISGEARRKSTLGSTHNFSHEQCNTANKVPLRGATHVDSDADTTAVAV